MVVAAAALAKLVLAPTCKPWLANPRPSWRQATIASSVPQPSPQTRPQRGWSPSPAPTTTSTRPSKRLRPPLSRICRERQWQRHRRHRGCSPWTAGLSPAPVPAQPGLCCSAWGSQELSRAKHSFSQQGTLPKTGGFGDKKSLASLGIISPVQGKVHFEMVSFQK